MCAYTERLFIFQFFDEYIHIYVHICKYREYLPIHVSINWTLSCIISLHPSSFSLSLSLFSHTLFLSSLNLKLYLWQFHDIQSQIIMGNRLPFPPTPSSLSPHPPLPHLTDNNRVFGINLLIQRHSLRRNKSTVKTGTF